jgi:hypothetical protein
MSSGLKMNFNLDEYIVNASSDEVIAKAPYKNNIYQMTFFIVHMVDKANVTHISINGSTLKLCRISIG